ncbi:GTP-binding protein [Sutcliffiella deserti]|uniref:GTP-binding protein n=1 Tax=Sutcliffiella deserti TaxID=2875501 RepID=UPI001CBB9A5F|nr:GTP-binding protein [Sutcliffiella deserti]
MTTENKLIQKNYYETFILDMETKHPVQILGEAFLAEQKKEVYDMSFIRFAQGEVYYRVKDYESAIFKWENVKNELEPWAKKNIADAYYELDMPGEAEDIYTEIQTDNHILRIEVAMQLFTLYVERGKLENAYRSLRKAISINPDYPNVTRTAQAFFEAQEDWNSAVELAVNEAIRTRSPEWFERLKWYIEQNRHIGVFSPDYFQEVLVVLVETDQQTFEDLIVALWNSYRKHTLYLNWVKTANTVFLSVEKNTSATWNRAAALHQATYLELIDGKYLVRELESIVPDLLSNWLKISNQSNSLFAAAAIMSWSEVFTTAISADVLYDAENRIFRYDNDHLQVSYTVELFQTLIDWAKNNHLEVRHQKKWLFTQLTNLHQKHIVVTGTAQNGKTSFLNSLLGEKILGEEACPVFVRSDGDIAEIKEISHHDTKVVNDLIDHQEGSILELKWPSALLEEQHYSLISTSEFDAMYIENNDTLNFVPLSDGLLYVLDANTPFTEEELQILVKIKERAPEVPVHFLINKMDTAFHEAEATQILEETKGRINEFFPDARVYPYSSIRGANKQHPGLATFLETSFNLRSKATEERRTSKLLQLIRSTLTELLNSRISMEDNLVNTETFHEDILGRLNGFIHHLRDTELEKVRTITEGYRAITIERKQEVRQMIPKLLKGCSSYVKEDSNFSNLHLELNKMMNEKIREYMHDELLPKYRQELLGWMEVSHQELRESQEYLREMSESFNALYKEDRMRLECDFKVIEDLRRDINRMLSRADVEKENILNRPNTTQFLLKSAGRLFGSIQSNNHMLYNQYKKYIENERFDDVTDSVISKFFLEFDLFEKALKSDISMFYQATFDELNDTVAETEQTIQQAKEKLEQMKANPEQYYDPLKLFEVRLLQYEFMVKVCEDNVNMTIQ